MGYTNADQPYPRGEVGPPSRRMWSTPHPARPLPRPETRAQQPPCSSPRALVALRCVAPASRPQICVRGPILFKGYFKDEAATRDTIDAQGWLHTGACSGALHSHLPLLRRGSDKHACQLSSSQLDPPVRVPHPQVMWGCGSRVAASKSSTGKRTSSSWRRWAGTRMPRWAGPAAASHRDAGQRLAGQACPPAFPCHWAPLSSTSLPLCALRTLRQGEYVAPEKIEGVYGRSPFVLQAFVYGNSLRAQVRALGSATALVAPTKLSAHAQPRSGGPAQPCLVPDAEPPCGLLACLPPSPPRVQLVAVVVPDPEFLLPWAKDRGLPRELGALCAHPQVVAATLKSMLEEGRAAGLKGFEQVGVAARRRRTRVHLRRGPAAGVAARCGLALAHPRDGHSGLQLVCSTVRLLAHSPPHPLTQVAAVHLHPEPLSVDNGMMTPTFKLKRPQAQAFFQHAIDGAREAGWHRRGPVAARRAARAAGSGGRCRAEAAYRFTCTCAPAAEMYGKLPQL